MPPFDFNAMQVLSGFAIAFKTHNNYRNPTLKEV
jgi:hypothetical protein